MGLDLNALKGVQNDLAKRGENNDFFQASKIGEETDVRLLPPLPKMNGIYFVEKSVFWINKKSYTSPSTFGRPCIISEEVAAARGLKDAGVDALLSNKEIFKKSAEFLMPILLLDCQFGEGGVCTTTKVVDDKPKILSCGTMLMKAINKIVTSRQYQNGTPDGIADRVKGFNLVLGKTGVKLDTEYTAMGWTAPTEMDAKYYAVIPDVIDIVEKSIYPDEYLQSVIRNYLYGEELMQEPKKDTTVKTATAAVEAAPAKAATAARGAAPTKAIAPKVNAVLAEHGIPQEAIKVVEEKKEEATQVVETAAARTVVKAPPATVGGAGRGAPTAATTKTTGGQGRSLLDDVTGLDD